MKLQTGQGRTDAGKDARRHKHSKVANCGDYFSLTASGLDKNCIKLHVEHVTPEVSPILTPGHHLNNLGRGPLDYTTYQIPNF